MDCGPAQKKAKSAVIEADLPTTPDELDPDASNREGSTPCSSNHDNSPEVEADVEENADEQLEHGGRAADETYNTFNDEELCRGESFEGMDDEQKAEHIAMLRYQHILENEGPSSDSDVFERRQFQAYMKFQPRSKTPSDSSEEVDEEDIYGEEEDEYDEEEDDYEEETDKEEYDEEGENDEEEDEMGNTGSKSTNRALSWLRPLLRSEAELKSRPKMNRHFTGFKNFKEVCRLFEEIFPADISEEITASTLTRRQEFTLTLVRFRQNPLANNLAEYFDIPLDQVCSIFHKQVNAIHDSPHYSVEWPQVDSFTAEALQSYPATFRQRPVVLLDIVEVDIAVLPKNYRLRLQLFARRKQTHCIKFVLATTAGGRIVFVGKATGGRTPNAFVIRDSGVVEKLADDPRYVVIAPRNLLMEDLHADEWFVTPFFVEKQNGLPYLKPWDRVSCKSVKSLTDPVHEALNLCHRKMKLFSGRIGERDLIEKMRHDNLSYFDKLIEVWAALCNKCQQPLKPYD